MKAVYKIILSIVLFICVSNISYSQDLIRVDTAITVWLENNITDGQNMQYRFDIYLERSSNMWHLFENATFQMIFKYYIPNTTDTFEIDYSKFDVDVDVSSSEVLTIRDGTPAYRFYAKVLYDAQRPEMNRVKLMVIGPEEAIYSRLFEDNIRLKLCTIILKAKDMAIPLPNKMDWKEFKGDKIYFQAAAYTYIDSINTHPKYTIVKKDEDHIEIGWITSYKDRPNPDPILLLDEFEVEYTGNLNSVCRYRTLQEIDNAGFIIKRARTNAEYWYPESNDPRYEDLSDDMFDVVVGDYRMPEFTSRMRGQLFSHTPKQYVPIPDTLGYRIVNYVYRLYHQRVSDIADVKTDTLIKLATRGLLTPQAVIADAKASPNPSAGYSVIEYMITDDVYLTCEVFDQNGLRVKVLTDEVNGLLDMKYIPRGTHRAIFNAPELAVQGLYDVIFIAYPVNDKATEISRASVKIQLIRDYEVSP